MTFKSGLYYKVWSGKGYYYGSMKYWRRSPDMQNYIFIRGNITVRMSDGKEVGSPSLLSVQADYIAPAVPRVNVKGDFRIIPDHLRNLKMLRKKK